MLSIRTGIGAAVAVAAVAGAVAWRRPSTRPAGDRRANEDSATEMAALRARLARLESKSVWQAAMVAQQTRTAVPLEEQPPSRAEAPPPAPKEHAPDGVEYIAQLDDKFRSEAVDPNWSQKGIDDALRALSGNLTLGSRLGTVDCKADL